MTDNNLEERIKLLEEFLDETYDIHWFRALLDSFFLEFDYRGDGNAAKDLKQVKEMFSGNDTKERGILVEYDKLMWKGKYASQDGWDYIREIADEVRRIKKLPENSPVNLVEGTDEWRQASQLAQDKREQFIAGKREQVDKNYAYKLLVNAVGLRIRAYEQLVKNKDSLTNLMGLAQQPYETSWMSGSENGQGFLEGNISELVLYIDTFPLLVAELVSKVPRAELLEPRKALPETAQKMQYQSSI